jgi:WD40 repeat protein/predicted Ser/Thr protein kinase
MSEVADNLPDPLDAVVEDFLARRRRGEGPLPDEYAARHPDLARRIRELFPTLLLLEAGPRSPEQTPPGVYATREEPPAALGPFRIVREIGRGGMGVVYEAIQEPLGRSVALKVLPPEYARRPSYRGRFEREANAAATLHHTNIVPVFACGEHQGTLYFAMQLIDGTSLDQRASAAPLPVQEVARLGVQAAEALAHAHAKGVLHRDVKPANLLVDQQGTLWVADFGLAKADGAADLTESGELLGTLRYLAPERFEGVCDVRGDVYALGATLYELLAGRPAFIEGNRARLLSDITQGRSPPLRSLCPAIPADLEVVVQKAMATEPSERYPSAQALAEDLRLFLADLPVRARRPSAAERLGRWARRQPALAGLLATVTVLVAILFSGALLSAWRLNRSAQRALLAEREAKDRLFEGLLLRVHEGRGSGRPGQRFASLEAVRQAVEIARDQGRPAADLVALRNKAVACLALPDLRLEKEWEGNPPGTTGIGFDATFERYAWSFKDEGIRVRRLSDDAELCRLPVPPSDSVSRWVRYRFSPDGRYLGAHYIQWGEKQPLEVWDLEAAGGRRVVALADAAALPEFAADGGMVVARLRDGAVALIDLPSGHERRRLQLGAAGEGLALHPDGRLLALASDSPPRVQVCDLETGAVTQELPHAGLVPGLAWAPDGRLLAAFCDDKRVHLWDGLSGQKQGELVGHRWGGQDVAFDATGRWLASFGHGIWEVGARRQAVDLENIRVVGFRSRGELAAVGLTGRQLRLWALRPSDVYQELHGTGAVAAHLAFSPDGRWLATDGMHADLRLWDVGACREAARPPGLRQLLWGQDGSWFLARGADGFLRGPVHLARRHPDHQAGLSLGPPRRLLGPAEASRRENLPFLAWVGPGARRVADLRYPDGRLQVLDIGAAEARVLWQGQQPRAAFGASSPDGRLLATGCLEGGRGVCIWEADTGRLLRELPIGDASVAFSPDGRSLYTATGRISPDGAMCSAWRVGSWERVRTLPLDRSGSSPPAIHTAPDGLVAVAFTMDDMRLLDPDTFAEIATLTTPEPQLVISARFSPDGSMLATTASGSLRLWDLRRLRAELAGLGLDWDRPPYPPMQTPGPNSGPDQGSRQTVPPE